MILKPSMRGPGSADAGGPDIDGLEGRRPKRRPLGCIMPILRPLDEIAIASWLKRIPSTTSGRRASSSSTSPPSIWRKRWRSAPELRGGRRVRGGGFVPPSLDEGRAPEDRRLRRLDGVRARRGDPRERFSLIIGEGRLPGGERRFLGPEGGMDFERARPMSMILGPTAPATPGRRQTDDEISATNGEKPF